MLLLLLSFPRSMSLLTSGRTIPSLLPVHLERNLHLYNARAEVKHGHPGREAQDGFADLVDWKGGRNGADVKDCRRRWGGEGARWSMCMCVRSWVSGVCWRGRGDFDCLGRRCRRCRYWNLGTLLLLLLGWRGCNDSSSTVDGGLLLCFVSRDSRQDTRHGISRLHRHRSAARLDRPGIR